MRAHLNRSTNWVDLTTSHSPQESSTSAIPSLDAAPSASGSSSRTPPQSAMRLSPKLRIRVHINNANLKAFDNRLRLEEAWLGLAENASESAIHKQACNRILIFLVTLAELRRLIEREDAPIEITPSSRQLSFPVSIDFDNEKSFRKDATAEFSETGRLEQLSFDFPGFGRLVLDKDGIAEERLPQERIESDDVKAESPVENVYDTLISRSPTPDVVERTATPHAEMGLAAEVRHAIDSLPDTLPQRQQIVDWISASVVALRRGLSDATKISETSGSSVHHLISAISTSTTPDTMFRTEMYAHVSSEGQVISLKLQCPAFGSWEFPVPGTSRRNVSVAGPGTIEEPLPLQVPGNDWTQFIKKISKDMAPRAWNYSSAALANLKTNGIPYKALCLKEDAPPGMSLKAMQVLVKSHPLLNDGSLDVAGLSKDALATKLEELARNHNNCIPITNCEQVLVALSPAAIFRSLVINLHGPDATYGTLTKPQRNYVTSICSSLTAALKLAGAEILKPYKDIQEIRMAAGINPGTAVGYEPSDIFHLHLLNVAESASFVSGTDRKLIVKRLKTTFAKIEKHSDPWAGSFIAMLAQKQDLTEKDLIRQIQKFDPIFGCQAEKFNRPPVDFLLKNLAEQLTFFNSLEQEKSKAVFPSQNTGTNTSSQTGLSGTGTKKTSSAQGTSGGQPTTVNRAGNTNADVEEDLSIRVESEGSGRPPLKRKRSSG